MTAPDATSAIAAADGTELVAYRWEPAGAPRAVVQITHGMGEHAQRYGELAAAFAGAGYAVLAVDQRGHGATAGSPEALGDLGPGGWEKLVQDIGTVGDAARALYPAVPLVLFAHSMGSFAAQQFVLTGSERIDALVLTGTAAIDLMEPALDLSVPIDLTGFNAAFEPARTPFDWLTRDEAIVDAYIADPWCGFGLDVASGQALFAGARPLADPGRVAEIRSDLPVHIVVGEADPVNAGLALVQPIVDRLRAAGLGDVTLRSYPDGRHEICNELNRAEVCAELVAWVERALP